MIIYNMNYRGPFEYDKMVLNAMQLSNYVNKMNTSELSGKFDQLQVLSTRYDNIASLNELEKNIASIGEELYIQQLYRR